MKLRWVPFLVVALSILILVGIAACGGASSDARSDRFTAEAAIATVQKEVIIEVPVVVEREVIKEVPIEVMKEVIKAVPVMAPFPTPAPAIASSRVADFGAADEDMKNLEAEASRLAMSLPVQDRIIVRTVDMALVVTDVPKSLDAVDSLAQELGGWVLQSSRNQIHRGFMAIRVPAERVDEAIARLRGLAHEVKSENSTSRDVTDEYVDNQARLKNLQATEVQLLKLMERTAKVEELLEVQRELTNVQGEIERLQGRIKLLEETSAFSLINVNLELAPAEMTVDAGPDQTSSEEEPARFRATFTPPEDIDEFRYEWDFGDGSRPVMGTRTAPKIDGESRTTATVTHFYRDMQDSPFIVTFKITGTGEAGIAEGEDTLITTITRVPNIEVFAGRDMTVEEDEELTLTGSFTRPEGISDPTFRWDFGDGSEPVTGDLSGTDTTTTATHVYPNHRPIAFNVTLTVTGTTETGAVKGTSTLRVFVTKATSFSAGSVKDDAVGALGSTGRGLARAGIWLGILSPLWVAALAVAGYLVWRHRRSATRS